MRRWPTGGCAGEYRKRNSTLRFPSTPLYVTKAHGSTIDDGLSQVPSNEAERRRFKAIFERIPPDTEEVLDVGSARHSTNQRVTGNLHAYLADRLDAHLAGIDVLPEEVERMREEGYDVVVADAETFSFEETFDAIVAGELIEHLANPGRFIENAVSHLSPEGKLVLTSPNPDGFVFFRKALLDQSNNHTHTCWIDPSNCRRLCELVGAARLESIEYLPPDGGISSLIWSLGNRRAASPTYVATIDREGNRSGED